MELDIKSIGICDNLEEVITHLRKIEDNNCLEPFSAILFQKEYNKVQPNFITIALINAFYNGISLALRLSDKSMLK